VTHKYIHPDGKGFGEHHVEASHPVLSERSATWQGVAHPEGGQWDVRPGELTMKDLDMPSGTEVELLEDDEDRNLKRVSWKDAQGTPRITSVEPAFFDTHFQEA
jgi:hypothetical protein